MKQFEEAIELASKTAFSLDKEMQDNGGNVAPADTDILAFAVLDMQAKIKNLSAALDSAIEQITAQLVHGDVNNEGWQLTLNELVAVQKGAGE